MVTALILQCTTDSCRVTPTIHIQSEAAPWETQGKIKSIFTNIISVNLYYIEILHNETKELRSRKMLIHDNKSSQIFTRDGHLFSSSVTCLRDC